MEEVEYCNLWQLALSWWRPSNAIRRIHSPGYASRPLLSAAFEGREEVADRLRRACQMHVHQKGIPVAGGEAEAIDGGPLQLALGA